MVICSCLFRVSNSQGTTVFLIEFQLRRIYYTRFNTRTKAIVELALQCSRSPKLRGLAAPDVYQALLMVMRSTLGYP